jgi:hypothetical protein
VSLTLGSDDEKGRVCGFARVSCKEASKVPNPTCPGRGLKFPITFPDATAPTAAADKLVTLGTAGQQSMKGKDEELDFAMPAPVDPDERAEYVKRRTRAFPEAAASVRRVLEAGEGSAAKRRATAASMTVPRSRKR